MYPSTSFVLFIFCRFMSMQAVTPCVTKITMIMNHYLRQTRKASLHDNYQRKLYMWFQECPWAIYQSHWMFQSSDMFQILSTMCKACNPSYCTLFLINKISYHWICYCISLIVWAYNAYNAYLYHFFCQTLLWIAFDVQNVRGRIVILYSLCVAISIIQ